MKKILNKKGFTLIELLAVIIILAVIMVFAVPAILDTSNTAQQKAFQLYAQRVLTKATEYVETQKMLGVTGNLYQVEKTAYDQSTIGLGQNTGYGVCIRYDRADENDAGYTLTLYITNGTYCYKGQTDTVVSAQLPSNVGCPANSAYGVDGTAAASGATCKIPTE